jgi:hypothetical protein
MVGPANTQGSFTFTQKSPDCSVRIDSADSVALPVTKYYKTPGVKSSVILPFADFAKNALGADFDFVHLKGWVMIKFTQNAVFEFSNFKVLKCKPAYISNESGSLPGSLPGSGSTSSTAASQKPNGSKSNFERLLMMIAGVLSLAVI